MRTKVLHIITRLDKGGSATNTIDTVALLDKKKYKTILISGKTNDPDGEILRSIKNKKVRCIFVEDLQRVIHPWRDLKAFFRLHHVIRRGKYTLVHTHSSKAGVLGRWAAWIARTKCIVHTPHGHVFYGYFNKLVSAIFIYVEMTTGRITDKIITLTQKGKEEHLEFKIAKADKFIPIYSGINLKKFGDVRIDPLQKRKDFNLSEESLVIGSVSRLDPIKGNEFLVEAMAEVVQFFPTAVLLLVGDGTHRTYLEKKARDLNIYNHVIFAGFREDVPELINMMDIFVLPSLNEGMGRAILEAMACGKPVISTRTGGIPELIREGETGLLVDPGDARGLAEAIMTLMAAQEKSKAMGAHGRIMAGDIFSVEKMVSKIDALYQELLEVKR